MPTLELTQSDYDLLRAHGEETYPHECCGVLLGLFTNGDIAVASVVRAGNTRLDSLHNRYNIDPAELVRIQRQARNQGLDIVGFYHSHPDHPAMWSSTDFAEAHWLGCAYVITSTDGVNSTPGTAKAILTNAWLLTGASEEDKQFHDLKVEVISA